MAVRIQDGRPVESNTCTMTISDLTDAQLQRLNVRVYHMASEGDHWGVDARTLRITRPGLYALLSAIGAEWNRRKLSEQEDN